MFVKTKNKIIMKFIKNHIIAGVKIPFSEMEILPLIENLKDAKEYAANIGKEIEYYSGTEGYYYVPKSIVGDSLFFIVVNDMDTYDIIELNKNEEIEIKDGICSIKKKKVLDFETIWNLFAVVWFGGVFVWDLCVDPDNWTFVWFVSFFISLYIGVSTYLKKNRSCKKI